MPTPTDPYSSAARRPFDEDDILAPIQPASQPTPEVASGYSSITAASAEEPRGMDPAFDSDPNTAGPTSLADALAHSDEHPIPEAPAEQESEAAPSIFDEIPSSPAVDSRATPTPTGLAAPAPATAPVSIPDAPAGRGWTHTGVLIATLLLVPTAWYLLSDAGVRLASVPNSPWETGIINWAAVAELAGGIAVAFIIWMLASKSSLGVQVAGVITAAIGIVPIVAPTFVRDTVLPHLDSAIGGYNDFTANVVDHVTYDLSSGRMLIYGALLLFTGFVSHSVRRQGERAGAAATSRAIALESQAH